MNGFVPSSSSPQRIRQGNIVAALQALFAHGQLSRAELARHLGLNRSSSGHIVSELVAGSLVREVSEEEQRRRGRTGSGRPGILLELDPQAAFFVGAEIGVEHITTLRIDLAAQIASTQVVPFDGRATSVEDAIRLAVDLAFGDVPADLLDRVEGFGLSAPAQMDRHGSLRVAPILGWRDVDLAALISAALPFDLPVMVENEANAFAFGESYRDQSKRSGVTLFLVMESGVGGGIVIDGRLFRGSHGLAGEIGHVLMRDGYELEQLLGLDRLLERHRAVTMRSDTTLEDFLTAVNDREPKAVEIAEEWARDLAVAVVAASRLIDPGRIVLGGSVAALYPMVAARVAHHISGLQAATFPSASIEVHESPETGAAFGSACMLHRRFLLQDSERVSDSTLE